MNAQQPVYAFADDQRGSIAIVFALTLVVLMGVVGLAVDTSRYYNFSSRMQVALDAAALAGAKLLPDEDQNDSDITTMVQAHFDASMANTGVQAKSVAPLSITIDRASATVEARSNVRLPSFFTGIANGRDTLTINRTSKVAFDMKKVELSLVLDITGSMNNKNKIADMKVAAKDVVDELYNGSLSEDGVKIALAPYSASVNAGSLASAVTNVPTTTTCSWVRFQWRCQNTTGIDQDTCVIERTGANAATDAAPVGADKLPNVPTLPYGNYVCPPSTVLPLQGKSQKDTVKNTIDSYAAAGSTAGHIGTAWGWYLLSPNWSGVLPGASAPKPYGEPMVDKAMIVMTDGLFNTSYLSGATSDLATQTNESYAQFRAICDGAKAKDIKVYTVGFDLADARALSELQGCASEPGNFFDAKTGADLKAAFHAIAQKLNTLRVAS